MWQERCFRCWWPARCTAAGSAWFWPLPSMRVFYVYGAHIGFMGYVVLGIGLARHWMGSTADRGLSHS